LLTLRHIFTGNSDLNELMAHLIRAVEDAEERKVQDILEEVRTKSDLFKLFQCLVKSLLSHPLRMHVLIFRSLF